MIVLLNVLVIGGLIFCLFASIYLEWAMVFDGGFQILPFSGIVISLIGHCVFWTMTIIGIEKDANKDSITWCIYSALINCGVVGIIQSLFYRDTFVGEDGFGGILAIIIPGQLIKCVLGCLVGIYCMMKLEEKMRKRLSKIRSYYQNQIDILDVMEEKIVAEKENDVSLDNLMNLFCALDCRRTKQLYRETSSTRNKSLIEQLQKMALDVQMDIIHPDMTVPEIATVIQLRRVEAQSKIQYYDVNNFNLSDRWEVARDYKRITK